MKGAESMSNLSQKKKEAKDLKQELDKLDKESLALVESNINILLSLQSLKQSKQAG